jgi:HK97 family phage portal protein
MKSQSLFSFTDMADGHLGVGSSSVSGNKGYQNNPIVYRCVRMIAEAGARVPFMVKEGEENLSEHPVLSLLSNPNSHISSKQFMERIYSFLQTSGNAYLEAVFVDGQVKALFDLRPDRMSVVVGKDGYPIAYSYEAGNKVRKISQSSAPISKILHLKLFNPNDDYYGLSPLKSARVSLEIHNAASNWNRSLLENAARPSGALVYSAANGNLSSDQFERLKSELEQGFAGVNNAGRPMVLEGGLDWKTIALTPKDMDFMEAKNGAAREIALSFGVPPMLLGIPGDNTYANYAEANKVLWRQSVMPLVHRVAADLTSWLSLAFEDEFEIVPDVSKIEALAEDRAALWSRISSADFLDDDEKREQVGLPMR